MGYTIIIGEACFEGSREDAYFRVWAKPEAHDDAPVFPNDPLTGNGNSRSPGYSAWTDFCRDTGLYGMFYGVNGRRDPYMQADPDCHREVPILAEHPGVALLNERDVLAVKHALDQHIAKHGDLAPGFRKWDEKDEDMPAHAMESAQRARLIWLHYWSDWAVRNCTWPVIANS
jgi:hypothetical protein